MRKSCILNKVQFVNEEHFLINMNKVTYRFHIMKTHGTVYMH